MEDTKSHEILNKRRAEVRRLQKNPRYIGTASVVACTEEDNVYKVKGCEKKVFCFAPTALGRVPTKLHGARAYNSP